MDDKMNLFNDGQIISATRSDEEFLKALNSRPYVVFDLDPDLTNISAKVKKAHSAGKKYFMHIDLAKGIGKDESAMKVLKKLGIDGIISTKVSVIKAAREQGLFTVQRFFIVDSHSMHTTEESVKSSKPDMIEIMPGAIGKVIERLKKSIGVPIIAGGLIESIDEVKDAWMSGAIAVSTGKSELWSL